MARYWQTDSAGVRVINAVELPDLPEGLRPGDLVKARLLGWSGEVPDGEEPPELRSETEVTGILVISYLDGLDAWRYSVSGQSIDPATIVPLESAVERTPVGVQRRDPLDRAPSGPI